VEVGVEIFTRFVVIMSWSLLIDLLGIEPIPWPPSSTLSALYELPSDIRDLLTHLFIICLLQLENKLCGTRNCVCPIPCCAPCSQDVLTKRCLFQIFLNDAFNDLLIQAPVLSILGIKLAQQEEGSLFKNSSTTNDPTQLF
jgi:hypothetical protein